MVISGFQNATRDPTGFPGYLLIAEYALVNLVNLDELIHWNLLYQVICRNDASEF